MSVTLLHYKLTQFHHYVLSLCRLLRDAYTVVTCVCCFRVTDSLQTSIKALDIVSVKAMLVKPTMKIIK